MAPPYTSAFGAKPRPASSFFAAKAKKAQAAPPPCTLIDTSTEAFQRFLEQMETPKEFLDKLSELCAKPYMCTLCGEPARDVLRMRRQFVREFLPENRRLRPPADASDPADASPEEVKFAAWALMKQHSGALYVGASAIGAYCAKNGLDVEAVMNAMQPHGEQKGLYTSDAVRRCERSIMDWLARAQPLQPVDALLQDGGIVTLDAPQNAAVRGILGAGYSVLQGNAGCGKTRTIAALMDVLAARRPAAGGAAVTVLAAAFTHKAKNCMLDRLKADDAAVSTVHSLIARLQNGGAPPGGVFLVLDESSMLDVDLLGSLAQAMLSKGIRYQLCFVGDYFQIQPVGRGEVFRMLVDTGRNVHNLTKCYRTEFLDLEANYQRLREGRFPQTSEHFEVAMVQDDAAISALVKDHIAQHLDGHKIICWQNHHIKMINKWVQDTRLAARAIGPQGYRGLFYLKDKVVFVGQNDDPTVTNATNGEVVAVTAKDVTVLWDTGARRSYTKTSNLQLSYAITAHKAQGSEYPHVLVACYDAPKMAHCLDKRWLYTCVTRGKESVKLACTKALEGFVGLPLRAPPVSDMAF